MKEKILESIRKELLETKEIIIKYNKDIQRLEELKQDSKVQEYINLLKIYKNDEIKHIEYTKQYEINAIIRIYQDYLRKNKVSSTNDIYVYLGTFKYSWNDYIDDYSNLHTKRNDKDAYKREYWNIEQEKKVEISIDEVDKFEQENIIIYPEKILEAKYYFKEIQKEFFIDAIKTNQEEAVKRLVKKYVDKNIPDKNSY